MSKAQAEALELTGGEDSELDSRFDDFWEEYPRKEGKKAARTAWKNHKHRAEEIIADVRKRKQFHYVWRDGFVPLPTSYLNGERWDDEITEDKPGKGKKKQKKGPEPWLQRHQAYINQIKSQARRPKVDKWHRRGQLILLRWRVRHMDAGEEEFEKRLHVKNRLVEDFRSMDNDELDVSHWHNAMRRAIFRPNL